MQIPGKVIENTVELAQLNFSNEDLKVINTSMSEILTLIEQMREVNTSGVTPMSHPLDATQRLRSDEVTEPGQRTEFQSVAPETSDGVYLVPRVIE